MSFGTATEYPLRIWRSIGAPKWNLNPVKAFHKAVSIPKRYDNEQFVSSSKGVTFDAGQAHKRDSRFLKLINPTYLAHFFQTAIENPKIQTCQFAIEQEARVKDWTNNCKILKPHALLPNRKYFTRVDSIILFLNHSVFIKNV